MSVEIPVQSPVRKVVGNLVDAQKAVYLYRTRGAFSNDLPEGWEVIGSGSTRVVFLFGNVVYKVGSVNTNLDEYMNYRPESALPDGWRMAECSLYEFHSNRVSVIAMERITGIHPRGHWGESHECEFECIPYPEVKCYAREYETIYAATGLFDIWEENVIVDESGTYVFIDYAS